jgi:hypothetical protein
VSILCLCANAMPWLCLYACLCVFACLCMPVCVCVWITCLTREADFILACLSTHICHLHAQYAPQRSPVCLCTAHADSLPLCRGDSYTLAFHDAFDAVAFCLQVRHASTFPARELPPCLSCVL